VLPDRLFLGQQKATHFWVAWLVVLIDRSYSKKHTRNGDDVLLRPEVRSQSGDARY
jgi:hypothetical protein